MGLFSSRKSLNKEIVAFLFPIYIYNFLENIHQLHSQATSQKKKKKLYFISHHGKLPKPYSSAQKVNKLRAREEAC